MAALGEEDIPQDEPDNNAILGHTSNFILSSIVSFFFNLNKGNTLNITDWLIMLLILSQRVQIPRHYHNIKCNYMLFNLIQPQFYKIKVKELTVKLYRISTCRVPDTQ